MTTLVALPFPHTVVFLQPKELVVSECYHVVTTANISMNTVARQLEGNGEIVGTSLHVFSIVSLLHILVPASEHGYFVAS
jgi:hypothetical protein